MKRHVWTAEEREMLSYLCLLGKPASDIAEQLNRIYGLSVTPNAVVGQAYLLDLPTPFHPRNNR